MLPDSLVKFNPWWSAGQLPQQFTWPRKRFFIDKLITQLEKPYITLLTGLRRTGKTVLVYQCIQQLLAQGIPPENILYLSYEDLSGQNLHEIIETYRNIALPKGQIYCFFDEIHYLSNWSNQIKFYYDQRVEIKFVVTGSSSHLLFKATSESLVGRVNILPLYPMNFREYLHLKSLSIESTPPLFRTGVGVVFEKQMLLLSLKEQFQPEFQTYLKYGGIPEYLDKSMKIDTWYQFLRQNYLALVLFKDILMNYEIRDSRALLRLTQYLAGTITTPQSLPSIGAVLGIKKETVANYLRYLEEAFLIGQATFFSASPAKALRRNNKIYLSDIGLTQALYSGFTTQSDTGISKVIENLVFQELRAFLVNQTGAEFPLIHYWKDKYEVDFIIRFNNTIFPIEVKYSNRINLRDLRGLINFCSKFNINSGIVVTKDIFEMRKISDNLTIYLIPAVVFSLILS